MPRGRPRKNPVELTENKLEELKNSDNPAQLKIETIVSENFGLGIGVKIETPLTKTHHISSTPVLKEEALLLSNVKSVSSSVIPEVVLSITENSTTLKEVKQNPQFGDQIYDNIKNEILVETLPEKTIVLSIEKNNIENTISNKKNIPLVIRKRNEYGLLENVDYVFKEDGKVDWRKMIPSEFLVFNREKKDQIESQYGKKLDEISVTEVEDKYLLILLFGIRYLASLRGFYSIRPRVDHSSDTKAVVSTNIDWIANNDTEMRAESYGDVAAATPENTNGFGRLFLESIAANRAFVRAVRNYLEINIVGADEIKIDYSKNDNKSDSPISVHAILENTAKDLGLTFDQFKEGVKNKYSSSIESDFSKWNGFKDLPPGDAYKMVNILKKASESKKK